ncbi:ankyrin [Lojkania enalia]|uniref:Ankyrin n=1 Tax=Lojkania enalia TaxID=147567 RepID=A0A9P4N4A1_9PLEO|nr:ankyrin [Didymosphaeria enalia]
MQNGGNPNSICFWDCRINFADSVPKETALLQAIKVGDFRKVTFLIESGANVNFPARLGIQQTPLQYAVELGRDMIVRYLLQKGADANGAPALGAGATALQFAAMKGFCGLAALLLEYKADINAPATPYNGRTAIEIATEHGRLEMMQYLIENGADIISDGGTQYNRARKFAEKNGKITARNLLDTLYWDAISNSWIPSMPEILNEEEWL